MRRKKPVCIQTQIESLDFPNYFELIFALCIGNFKLWGEEVLGSNSFSSSFEPQYVLVFENRVYSYVGRQFQIRRTTTGGGNRVVDLVVSLC
jgi:hypothetical protein